MAKKTTKNTPKKTTEKNEIQTQEELNTELNNRLSSLISIFKAVNPNIGGIQIFLNKATDKWSAIPMYFDPADAEVGSEQKEK